MLTLVDLFLFLLHLVGLLLKFRLFGLEHVLLLSELGFLLFDIFLLFIEDLPGLQTVLIQVDFLKGHCLVIVTLILKGDKELHDALSSFELVFKLVLDGLECCQLCLQIPLSFKHNRKLPLGSFV